ncbi:MAG: iron(III) transport system substrate-binding protein, partial [Alphaproteobacteria bacterium]|nr:iron(III) transport system substrate-binding protein [Alphaproteobacteria bacterium]
QIAPLMNRFSQKYPFIRLKFYRAGGSEVAQRVTIEYQARFFAVDAFELGSDSLLVPRAHGILQPFASPEMAAYPPDAIEAQRLWVSARESYGGLSYNTRLVAPEQAPKIWPDLLKPQYKGRMAFPGSTTTSAEWTGILLTTYGEDFVRKLGAQDIRIYKMTARALQNLVTSGEVAIAARASNAHVAEDRRKNAPVAWVAPGPVPVTATVTAVAARPPHPHAAMLMVDFLLSEEGQKMYQEIGYNSARRGLEDRDTPKEKIYFTQRPTFVEDFEKWGELFRDVFVNRRRPG